MAYMVAVCGSYLFACGKTSNMQLSQNNLSLQAIWLDVNWSMTVPIYSLSRWLFSFVVVFDTHVIVLVSLLNRMFAFMLHSEYTSCFMAKSVVWHNFQSSRNKQARQTFHCFVLNSHFIQPSECKYVLFACLSVRMQVSFIPLRFRYFGGRFSFRTVDLLREIQAVSPTLWFSWKRIKIIFRGRCRLRKLLKSAKINPHVFLDKTAKIWWRENITVYGNQVRKCKIFVI